MLIQLLALGFTVQIASGLLGLVILRVLGPAV
jgi:hypothetical protein